MASVTVTLSSVVDMTVCGASAASLCSRRSHLLVYQPAGEGVRGALRSGPALAACAGRLRSQTHFLGACRDPSSAFACTQVRTRGASWPVTDRPLVRCSSSPAAAVSGGEPAAGPQRTPSGDVPRELASLEQLVARLSAEAEADSASGDEQVTELKKAFGALAEDLKRQISSVQLSAPAPTPVAAASQQRPVSGPGRRRLTPRTDSESFRASTGLSDLDGVIPRSRAQREREGAGEDGTGAKEPTVPRSEVITMRSRLNKKLSESNTYNRFLLREMQYREEAIKDTKAILVALVSELREISAAVAELASVEAFLPSSTVSPACKPSLLAVKVKALLDGLDGQLKGVDAMKLRDIPLVWYGMAEDVKVMGSFDGWTYGEQLSPETTGTMTRFSTVLKLRPGSYEIKFLVDGEWRVAPEWPTTGHGMVENNILVVD